MNRVLFVAWRSGGESNGRWSPVGRLERCPAGYRFVYTRGVETLDDFRPFPGMPDLDCVYESDELFPLFANRLLATSRPEYERYLSWGGFAPDAPPDPIALLSVTEGRRETDRIEVFPRPVRDADGCFVAKFFLHGIRWMATSARERIDQLKPGEPLGLMLDLMNAYDPKAVAVRTCDEQERMLLGYVPRYLACDVARLCLDCRADCIAVRVERVNRDAPLQHRLLCSMRACWPEGFEPCSGPEFEPLAALPVT